MAKRNSSDVNGRQVHVVVRLPEARKVPFSSYVTPDAMRVLRELENEMGLTRVQVLANALNSYFKKRRKPPVA